MTRITTSTFDSVIDEFRRDPFNVGFDSLFDRLVDFQTTVNPAGFPSQFVHGVVVIFCDRASLTLQ